MFFNILNNFCISLWYFYYTKRNRITYLCILSLTLMRFKNLPTLWVRASRVKVLNSSSPESICLRFTTLGFPPMFWLKVIRIPDQVFCIHGWCKLWFNYQQRALYHFFEGLRVAFLRHISVFFQDLLSRPIPTKKQ